MCVSFQPRQLLLSALLDINIESSRIVYCSGVGIYMCTEEIAGKSIRRRSRDNWCVLRNRTVSGSSTTLFIGQFSQILERNLGYIKTSGHNTLQTTVQDQTDTYYTVNTI